MKLGWIAVKGEILTVHLKQIGDDKVTALSPAVQGSIFGFVWTPDSRRLLYWQDQSGNENYHIYLADSDHPDQPAVDLTPFENTRASIHQIVRADPDNVLIAHNNRDRTVYDLYRVNLKNREQTMLAQNPGNVLIWFTDDGGNLRARVRKNDEEMRIFDIFNAPENTWKALMSLDMEDSIGILSFTAEGDAVWALSNRRRDRISLVRMDLATGNEKLVYEDPQVDLSGAFISYHTIPKNPWLRLHFRIIKNCIFSILKLRKTPASFWIKTASLWI